MSCIMYLSLEGRSCTLQKMEERREAMEDFVGGSLLSYSSSEQLSLQYSLEVCISLTIANKSPE